MTTLIEMQKKQKIHDEHYHRDIYFLSHQERFKHIAFHFGKYSGRMARIVKRLKEEGVVDPELTKTLTDSFIIILNTAEIFGLDLEQALTKQFALPRIEKARTISEVANELKAARPSALETILSSDKTSLPLNLLLEYTDIAHAAHKACDSLDHMEGLDREKITSALVNLLGVVIVAGHRLDMNFEISVPARWREIELSKLL